jgi:hypothetical protein
VILQQSTKFTQHRNVPIGGLQGLSVRGRKAGNISGDERERDENGCVPLDIPACLWFAYGVRSCVALPEAFARAKVGNVAELEWWTGIGGGG